MRSSFVALAVVLGAIGLGGGLWPLFTGRNYPGFLGRGFTAGDNLRLKRAPAIYFRAVGTTIASAGLAMLALAHLMLLPSEASAPDANVALLLLSLGLVVVVASVAWLFVLAYRYKLFRWNAP